MNEYGGTNCTRRTSGESLTQTSMSTSQGTFTMKFLRESPWARGANLDSGMCKVGSSRNSPVRGPWRTCVMLTKLQRMIAGSVLE